MYRLSVEEVATSTAMSDANAIFRENKTVGLTANNFRRWLKEVDADHLSDYFNKGRSLYHLYVQTLTREVDRIFAEHGMKVRYDVPTWDESFTWNPYR